MEYLLIFYVTLPVKVSSITSNSFLRMPFPVSKLEVLEASYRPFGLVSPRGEEASLRLDRPKLNGDITVV